MGDAPRTDPGAIRLGVVSYLNAMPLVHALEGGDGIEIVGAPPSGIAEWLRDGRIDVGLVPVIELIRQPGLEPVSNACVASSGPVDSVLLLLRTEPHLVRSCALDKSSRTSQVLTRILLEERGARPRFREDDPADAWARGEDDAVLVIGDQALRMRRDAGARALDLATDWRRMTDLPFVFAVWAARPGVVARRPDLALVLESARDRGVRRVREVARACGAWGGLDEEQAVVYLTDRIRYRLAAPERAGLATFLELARKLGEDRESEEPCSTSS